MVRKELSDALKKAMKARDTRAVATIRLINAAIKEKDIDRRGEDLSDAEDDAMIIDILTRMVKQRRESIKAYEEAGRCSLAEQEREEIDVIESFLPRQMDDDEIRAACQAVVDDLGADSLKDIGRCMAELKKRHAGAMAFSRASAVVKSLLS
ncbi:GatB/YqeY domain-containing protein [Yunchengibacter salinarum]|uniref:GatB/YqeY domain-containing protein n=1 Tax=Yunchengibacter salinarum TaxID=3133399 RepID=UPI0035B59AE5